MLLYYIDNLRIPTEKAHGVQIMKMAEALAKTGVALTLILPKKFNLIKINPFSYYKVEEIFKIKKIFSLNLIYFEKIFGKFGYWLENVIYTKLALIWVLFNKKPDIIYTRQVFIAFIFSLFFKNVYFEAHVFKNNAFYKLFLSRLKGIIVITRKLEELHKKILPNKKILVAYDGVDLNQFNLVITKEEARSKLNFPKDKKIILYTGHLYDWKGAQVLAEAAKFLPDNYQIYFVGGTAKDITNFRNTYQDKNINIVGHRPYQEIPLWLKAADVLVIPNSGRFEISRSYTSPMKLFEYLASQTPIIASDLPSLREILDESSCLFFQPDNSKDLAEKIKNLIADKEKQHLISKNAFIKVQVYDWQNRARSIINFIK